MTDPMPIIGLVASLVTFVDFGFKIISGSKSVRRSVDGMALYIGVLERSIKYIRDFLNSIMAQGFPNQRP